jgi:3-oxoacyl-[acyl-carrier-protein] synthase-3
MKAQIASIEVGLPAQVLENGELERAFPDWTASKIYQKTGISSRHIAAEGECGSDLAVSAAQKLFASGAAKAEEIDFILYCTQTPDYLLPTTACILQQALSLPTTCGALDFNLGCSGYVYGLSLAKGLIETGQSRCLLLITADTYSKIIHPSDRSLRTLFGDAATATLIRAAAVETLVGPFVYGTDGRGMNNLMLPSGGMRQRFVCDAQPVLDSNGCGRTDNDLFMNGAEIFSFTLAAVPEAVAALLQRAGIDKEAVDLFVFHQANKFILDHLQRKLSIPEEKFVVALETVGNTVSSTIPIALWQSVSAGRLRGGALVMLVGFGVGYSWAATLIRWPPYAR